MVRETGQMRGVGVSTSHTSMLKLGCAGLSACENLFYWPQSGDFSRDQKKLHFPLVVCSFPGQIVSVLHPARCQGVVWACEGVRQSSAGCVECEGDDVEGSVTSLPLRVRRMK